MNKYLRTLVRRLVVVPLVFAALCISTPFWEAASQEHRRKREKPPTGHFVPICESITAARTMLRPNETVEITVTASDPDGDPLTYCWSATAGTILPNGAKAVFDTTGLADDVYVVTVGFTDGFGHTVECSIEITVRSDERA